MARIIEYDTALAELERAGLACVYYHSGAFSVPGPFRVLGWIGPDDPTIRPELLPAIRRVAEPCEANLARMLIEQWNRLHPAGPMWIMPRSHWAYELDYGSRRWLPEALCQAGIDPSPLAGLNSAAAIEFALDEAAAAGRFVERLLENLSGSDFTAAFPGKPVVAMLHHHKQVWWQMAAGFAGGPDQPPIDNR